MSDWGIAITLSLAGGVGLGAAYFATLWWTVRRVVQSRHPGLLLGISFVVRMAILLLGFYVIMNGHWERGVACLIGFLVARTVMIRRLGPRPDCDGGPQEIGRSNPALADSPHSSLTKGGGSSPSSLRKKTSTSHG